MKQNVHHNLSVALTKRKWVGFLTELHTQFWREAEAPRQNIFANVNRSAVQAQFAVRCFYALTLYIALTQLQRWRFFAQLEPLNLVWPVAWLEIAPWPTALFAILLFFVGSAVLALVFSDRRWARGLVFLGVLEFYALFYSFNAVSHRDHLFVLAAFMLVLLSRPPLQGGVAQRKIYLMSFFGVQAMILLVYTMSGFMKLLVSLNALRTGGLTLFHPEALTLHIARSQLNGETLLGPVLLQLPTFGWFLFVLVFFLELFGFHVAFRPSLHRPYGAMMIGMHIGIAAAMGLFFNTHVLTVALFLVASPFVPRTFDFWGTVHDLPMVGPFTTSLRLKLHGRRKLAEPGNAVYIYYDGECGFCDRFVQTLLRHPLPANVKFGTRQGSSFRELQARYPYLATADSVATFTQIGGEERVYVRGEAALGALALTRGPQSFLFFLFMLIPPPFLDWGYRLITALRRHLIADHCTLPTAGQRERFIDL